MQPDRTKTEFRRYRPEDRRWVTAAHIDHYRNVEGFDAQFDKALSQALTLLERQSSEASSRFIIAQHERCSVGCIFFSAESERTGRIRLFYLDESYRGYGIGKQMLAEVVASAAAAGLKQILVSTFDRHAQACRLYRSFGFNGVIQNPAMAFGLRMRQVDFQLDLSG